MTWINLPSVSITNGSKTLTVNGGTSTANIKAGDGIQIGAFSLYEVAGVYASQLTLVKAWGNASQTNAEAVAVPTFGDFNAANEAMRKATDTTQGNFAEMQKWWTETGTVSFKGYDGETHSVRTAKQMDADAQQVQDDLTANIDANMVAKIAEASPANIDWDVDIPFNEGLEMARGFGNRDAYGNRAVDFSRASTQLYVNKSGLVEEAAIDEPCIQSDGILITDSATGLYTNSLDLSQSEWVGEGVVLAPSEDIGELTPVVSVPVAASQFHNAPKQSNAFSSIGWYLQTYIVKSKELGIVNFGSNAALSPTYGFQTCRVDFRDGSILAGSEYIVQLEEIANGWWILTHKFETELAEQGSVTAQIFSNSNEQIWLPNGTDGIYFAYGQLIYSGTEEPFSAPPLIKTETVSASVVANIPSLPARNNLPAPGQPFTIAVDCNLYNADEFGAAFYLATSEVTMLALSLSNLGRSYAHMRAGGVLYYAGLSRDAEDRFIRYSVVYDGDSLSLYEDSLLIESTNITDTPDYGPADPLLIGRTGAGRCINSEIKNLRIFHRALSDAEIKALGAAA